MTEYVFIDGKKFLKTAKKKPVRRGSRAKPVIKMVKPSQADPDTGEVMTVRQIAAIEKKLEELQGAEKKHLQVHIKNLALDLAEEMMLRLAAKARKGDRAAANAIIAYAIGKPTERKHTDVQPIQVLNDIYKNITTENQAENNPVGGNLPASSDTESVPRQ